MKLLLFYSILVFFCKDAFAQHYLSKEEIIDKWNTPEKRHKDSSGILNSKSLLGKRLHAIVDSLEASKIDSVIIFTTSHPGSISLSKCDTGIIPNETFIIWNKYGKTCIRKIKGVCSYGFNELPDLGLFNFYDNNKKKLASETFMPVIFSAYFTKKNTISFSVSVVSHEPYYSFFYKIGKNFRSFYFSESFIENRESLFYEHNLSLTAYHWWKMINCELQNLERQNQHITFLQ